MQTTDLVWQLGKEAEILSDCGIPSVETLRLIRAANIEIERLRKALEDREGACRFLQEQVWQLREELDSEP